MIGVIARHEAAQLWRSPAYWVVCALIAAACGYLFLRSVEGFVAVQDSLAAQDHASGLSGYLAVRYLAPLAVLFSVLGPVAAMRSFSDEFRYHTLSLWQSAPVAHRQLAMGKFLGSLLGVVLPLVLVVSLPLALRLLLPLDLGVLASSAVGLLLCAAAAVAIGVLCSSLTEHATLAIVMSLVVILLLWLLGNVTVDVPWMQSVQHLSPAQHLPTFFQGLLNSGSVLYFIIVIVGCLALTILRLDALRYGNAA